MGTIVLALAMQRESALFALTAQTTLYPKDLKEPKESISGLRRILKSLSGNRATSVNSPGRKEERDYTNYSAETKQKKKRSEILILNLSVCKSPSAIQQCAGKRPPANSNEV